MRLGGRCDRAESAPLELPCDCELPLSVDVFRGRWVHAGFVDARPDAGRREVDLVLDVRFVDGVRLGVLLLIWLLLHTKLCLCPDSAKSIRLFFVEKYRVQGPQFPTARSHPLAGEYSAAPHVLSSSRGLMGRMIR